MAVSSRLQPVRITFDKERGPRKFKLGFAEVTEFEEATGKNLFVALRDVPFIAVRQCVFLALRDGDSSMNLKKATQLVQEYLSSGNTIGDLIESIRKALEFSGVFEVAPESADEDEAPEGKDSAGDSAA